MGQGLSANDIPKYVRVLHARCKRVALALHACCTLLHACCTRAVYASQPCHARVACRLPLQTSSKETSARVLSACASPTWLKKPHAACSVQHATGSVRRPQTSVRHAPRPRARRPMCVQADTWRPIGASGTRGALQDSRKEGAAAHPVASGAAVVDELVQLGGGHEVLRRGLHQLSAAPPPPRCLSKPCRE